MNCVELDTSNGTANPAIVLLSKTNVTVCGSATCVGLYQLTVSPVLISTCWGENVFSGAVASPPPACTFIMCCPTGLFEPFCFVFLSASSLFIQVASKTL
jgi:hypothetical protein